MASKRDVETEEKSCKRLRTRPNEDASHRDQDEAEVGIIESVSLRNFMCHSQLEFKFGPNVNFVTGKNGSGKSAILTAVVVGLGGTANTTNRGTTLKNFIQNGKSCGDVAIRLRNYGEDAYKPDLYGRSITVERRFFSNGTSSYKLKSENHKVIANKKEELAHILDQFNIQVDNPLCILNQDASRKFLQSENPKRLYKLFLRATQLQQMREDYANAVSQKITANSILDKKLQAFQHLEKEERDWKAKIEQHESLKNLHSKLERLNKELTWSQIKDIESELSEDEKKLKVLESMKQKIFLQVQEWEQKLASVKSNHDNANDKMKKMKEEIILITSECETMKANLTTKKNILRHAHGEWQEKSNIVKSLTKDKKMLSGRLEELCRKEGVDYAAEQEKRNVKIREFEEEKAMLEATFETTELHCDHLKGELTEINRQRGIIVQEINTLRQQLDSNERKLRTFESSRSNYQKRFGEWVPDALMKIDAAFRRGVFSQKPRGPLGCFIKLRDAKWSLAVENCIKPLLFAFCCDNHGDERALEEVLYGILQKNNGRMPSIITSPFSDHVYDIQGRCVHSKYPKLLDILEIEDPVVSNCLIDQRHIECIILVENSTEARGVMQREVPRFCEEAFTLVGDQIFPSPKFRVYSSQKDKAELLQASMEENIRSLKAENGSLIIKQNELQNQQIVLNSKLNKHNTELKHSDLKLGQLTQQLRKIKASISELRSIEDPQPVHIIALEDDLKEIVSQLNCKQLECQQTEAVYNKCKDEYVEEEKKYKVLEEKLNIFNTDKLIPSKHLLATVVNHLHEAQSRYQNYEQKLRSVEEDIQRKTSLYDVKLGEVEKCMKGIEEKFGPRPSKLGDVDKIKNEIKQIRMVLDTREQVCGSREEVLEKFMAISKKNEEVIKDITALKEFLDKLESVLSKRNQFYRDLRSYIGIRIQQYFITLLGLRNFNGNLRFDHKEEKLYISIQSKTDLEKSAHVQTLSGGERSFSTVAFILSLWETIESPFRMMDEFDVFMDMVNRRFSMTMMIETASSKTANQFIFLTPLDMSHIKTQTNIRIYQMKDPDRSQSILPFKPCVNNGDKDEDK